MGLKPPKNQKIDGKSFHKSSGDKLPIFMYNPEDNEVDKNLAKNRKVKL